MSREREAAIGIAVGLVVLAGLSVAVGFVYQFLWPRLAEVSLAPLLFLLLPLIAMVVAMGVAVRVSEFFFTRGRLRPELESAAASRLRIMGQTRGLEDAVCALADMLSDASRRLAELAKGAPDLAGSLWQCDWAPRILARGRPVLEPIFGERRRALNLSVLMLKTHAEAISKALTKGNEGEFAETVAKALHAMTFPNPSARGSAMSVEDQRQLFLESLDALGATCHDFARFCEDARAFVRGFGAGGGKACYYWEENADLYLISLMLSSSSRILFDTANELNSLLRLRARIDWRMLRRRLERRDLPGAMRICLVH